MPNEDLNKDYEARHLINISSYQKKVLDAYNKAIDTIFKGVGYIQLKGSVFKLNDYPALNNLVNKTLLTFHDEVTVTLVNGIKADWELSIEKNANVISKAFADREISAAVNNMIYDPQSAALKSFTEQSVNGLNLSDRVWNYTNQFQSEIEQGLYVGISSGQSAASMATAQKQYLVNPDKLFRRVQDADGNLVLSKAAKAYNPGQGIYRSSYKNAFRMTRTVVNDSYRQSDQTKWQSIPFVLGYEVKTSNNHPKHDICDELAGQYGKDFTWLKWHIQCICYAVPILPSKEEFSAYEDAVLDGTDKDFKFKGMIKGVPDNFNRWVDNNTDRMKNWKYKPDWVTNNSGFTSDLK